MLALLYFGLLPLRLWAQEPYAVLSDNNTVLTFYYDDQKSVRNGMDVGPFNSPNSQPWYSKSITVVVFDTSFANCTSLTSTAYWFSGLNLLTIIGISNLKTNNVVDMSHMFSGCNLLDNIDLSNFDTANASNMSHMFSGCFELDCLDLSNFNTANVTDMSYMFLNCYALPSLDLSNFNTANVTEMKGMFSYCSSLTSIDLSNFNTANVTDIRWVFSNCSSLTTIFVRSEWDTANVTDGVGMFLSCAKLIGGNGTVYDENHVDYTYARIDKPGEPGYFTGKNAATETVAIPQFAVGKNAVFIHTATEQAVIYYTLDGSVPNENSTVYTDSIVVDRNCTIKAIAMRENYIPSPVATLEVDWFGVQTDTLILDLAYDGRAVTMTSNNDATIYYTLDGTEPTNRSATYDGKAVMLTGFCTVKAFATAEGKEPTEVMTYVVNSYFDGVTARVREGGSVDEAFQWCGGIGRAEGLAAIVWTCNEPFPQTAATVVRNPNLLLYVNDAKLAPSGITNVVADGRAQQILLTDNLQGDGTHGPAGFHVPQPFHVEGIISYSRTFSQTTGLQGDCRGWETIALPFTVQHFVHETQGECAPFAAGEKDKRSFWLCELTEQGFRDAASLRANTPYIIAMPENEAYARKYRLAGRVTFSASDTDVPATALETAHRGEASFVPCFSHQTASAAIYALNVGEECSGYAAGSVFENSYRDVWPFEAYRTTAQNGVRRLPIADDLSGATGIDNRVEVKDKRYSYYNLQGLPVKAPGKGVYIKGKQKVVFK